MGVWILVILFFFQPLFSQSLDEKYEEMLTEAEYYVSERNISVASLKLQRLQNRFPEPDHRFYALLGDLFVLEGRTLDALIVYTRSLELKPDQPRIAKFLYETHEQNKEPKKAFDVLRLYLSQEPNDRELRFQSLVLSKRLGEKKYYEFAMNRIKKSTKAKEKDLQDELKKIERQKDWKKLLDKSTQGYQSFPENKELYQYALIAQNKIDPLHPKMEEILLGMAAIFSDEKKYDIWLAQFYQKKGRVYEALNLYRRAFWHSLQKEKYLFEEDTLIFLRDAYYKMGWEKEALEISELIEMTRKKEDLPISELENRIRITSNREMLVYILFLAKEKNEIHLLNKYKKQLKERDESNWKRDFVGIFPVFYYEETE